MQDLLSVIAVGWHQRLELAQNEQQPSSLSALDRGTGGPLVRERAWGGLRAGGAKEMRLASPPFASRLLPMRCWAKYATDACTELLNGKHAFWGAYS